MSDSPYTPSLALECATHHAIFFMDENSVIQSWNVGGEVIFGYQAEEIVGCAISTLFTKKDVAAGKHVDEMSRASSEGYSQDDRWHVRKDGTRFWAAGMVTVAHDAEGRLIGYLKIVRDMTSQKIAMEHALYLSRHDELTGLPNRNMFHERLRTTLDEAGPTHSLVQVVLLDLDRFKEINDSYGHHVGDGLLKRVAERLRSIVRAGDLVARLGGDEFGVICKTADSTADGMVLANKLVSSLCEPYLVDEREIHTGASVGLTHYPADSRDAKQLLKNADLAMYAAKSSGGSTYRLYSEDLDADAKRHSIIAAWLQQALATDQLQLHYQPQYSLSTEKIVSFEAFLRWDRSPVEDLTPEEVVAVATEVGAADALGEWILRKACLQMSEWMKQGIEGVRVAVNVAESHLTSTSFLRFIDGLLDETGIPPGYLDLEITEAVISNRENELPFASLKKKGIHLTVDDFGTGTSALSDLKNFPVNALKIDQHFIDDLPHSEHNAAIASAIIGLAHSLDLIAVAEGIESAEQAGFLASLGCDSGQGYYFRPPLPADEVWQI